MSERFKRLVMEMLLQVDLGNFEKEMDHARMGAILRMAGGNPYDFETAAEMHHAREIARVHRESAPPPPKPTVGRPLTVKKKTGRGCVLGMHV